MTYRIDTGRTVSITLYRFLAEDCVLMPRTPLTEMVLTLLHDEDERGYGVGMLVQMDGQDYHSVWNTDPAVLSSAVATAELLRARL